MQDKYFAIVAAGIVLIPGLIMIWLYHRRQEVKRNAPVYPTIKPPLAKEDPLMLGKYGFHISLCTSQYGTRCAKLTTAVQNEPRMRIEFPMQLEVAQELREQLNHAIRYMEESFTLDEPENKS